jgi:ABC-type lipoprotein release transport system permease subunit
MGWINRQRNILDFTLSSLLRRKGKNMALLAVYTLIIFILASVVFLTSSLKREACLVLQDSPEIIVQRTIAGRHDLIPISYMPVLKEIRGVQSVRERLWGYYYDPATGANYTFVVPKDHQYGDGAVAIGNGVARTFRAGRGDIVPFRTHDGSYMSLEIKEIFSSESEIISSDLIVVSEEDFREIAGIPKGYATDLTLLVRNAKELPTIADKIKRALPDTRPIIRDEILRTYDAVFDWRGGILIAILSGAIMSFIIFAWDKATGLSSDERREIGILKGIGWETSDVILMKFWEGAVLSLSSFFLGIILAYVHVFFTSFALFEPVLKGWSILYPEFKLIPSLDPYQITTLFFLTVVPYTIATIVPSWRAATVDPDTIMRM